MRLFVTAYPPREVCDHLAAALGSLNVTKAADRGVNTRLSRRDTWHLTLAFLGEVPDERAPDAAAALAINAEPAEVRLAGGGSFGQGRFTVLWTGVESERLASIATAIRTNLKKSRLPYDHKPFTPHLTIARPADRLTPDEIAADRAALSAYAGPQWIMGRIELVRSHLGRYPTYDRLTGHVLGGIRDE